jgi:hypothetical protein
MGLFVTLSITTHIECHYAECRDICIVMLSVVMLNVVAPIKQQSCIHTIAIWPQDTKTFLG